MEAITHTANQALDHFTKNERGQHVLRRDRPEWVYELVRTAHADQMPNDARYNLIHEALMAIVDNYGDEEGAREQATEPPVALLSWLDGPERMAYCDEAAEDMGLAANIDMGTRIAMGYRHEADEVFGLVWAALDARAALEV